MSIDTNVISRTQIGLSEFIATPEKRKVPNHLLDTQIYTGICDNEIFHCRPSAIHFQGFNAGEKYLQKLRIINVSSECQRMHVIPPSTSDIFKIHYNKLDSLVPGMYLEVSVEFMPQENIYYDDCIRIHSKAAANLTVPIHAYLTMNVSSFPNRIHFKATQVGHSAVKKIPLKNDAAIDFGFQIVFIQSQSAFDIYPLSGVVPANNHIDILIKYSPSEYCTSCVNIQVIVSQFNCQPYHCSITGTSEPGIASKLKVKQIERTSREVVDPRTISPLGRSRTKKQLDSTKLIKKVEEKEIVKSGIRFPLNLNGHSAVSYVLSQKPGKLRAKDAKEVVKVQANSTCTSKQMKEVIFEHLVSKNVGEEQRNQLRWGVKLGEAPITKLYLEDILKQRDKAMKEYLLIQGDCNKNVEFERSSPLIYQDKIRRPAKKQSLSEPTFDLYLNDDWQKRHMVMGRFIQAARKVMCISRATKGLKAISIYLNEWRCGCFKKTRKLYDENNKEQLIVEKVTLGTIGTNMQPFSFPEYNHTNVKDDMAVDALDILPVKETAILLNTNISMYDLKVPLQYKLLHYNAHPFSSATHKYISKRLVRQLRTGLEKEFTQAISLMSTGIAESKEIEDNLPTANSKFIVPSCFLEPKDYHPLHIFNPMPGVHAHPEQLPYSEIDDDYSLSPLSRAMPNKLEREGVIPGVMNWKKFPSHGLVAMSTPSLYHVYVPRWSDPFGEELIPSNTPELLNSLPSDDQLEFDDPDDVSGVVVPNMDMVSAEFMMVEDVVGNTEDSEISPSFSVSMTLPNTNNPQSKLGMVSREKMKEELNLYLHKQVNNLGNKVKSFVSQTKSKWALDNL